MPVLEGQYIHTSREKKQLNGVFIMFSLLGEGRGPISQTKFSLPMCIGKGTVKLSIACI